MTSRLIKAEQALDRFSDWVGVFSAFLLLMLVVNVFYDVLMRYVFNDVSIGLQELEWHLYAMVFLLFTMGNVGLPGTSGFVGEILTMVGAFQANTWVALLAATGMVLHEFPEGIITYLLLMRAGFKKGTSLLFAFVAAAVTTPLGMLVSYPYVSKIDKPLLGALLAFSAGALIYVGATHLLPQAESEHKKYSLFALGAGVAVALAIVFSKA